MGLRLSLDPLTECDKCDQVIYPDDVFRSVPIPAAPGYVALIYKCEHCQEVGKLAKEDVEWEEITTHMSRSQKRQEKQVQMEADLALEGEVTVEMLTSLWKSLPHAPMMEVHPQNRCMCKDCKERRGV